MASEAAEEDERVKKEIERRNAEAAERAAQQKAERDAERARLDEVARRQREREGEAERRLAERSSGAGGLRRTLPTATPSPAARPTVVESQPGNWIERLAARKAAESGVTPSPAISNRVTPAETPIPSLARPATNGTPEPDGVPQERGGTYKRGMGLRGRGGTKTPPSTRGGATGSTW